MEDSGLIFDHRGSFNMHVVLDTRAFSLFVSIRKAATAAGIQTATLALQPNASVSELPRRVTSLQHSLFAERTAREFSNYQKSCSLLRILINIFLQDWSVQNCPRVAPHCTFP